MILGCEGSGLGKLVKELFLLLLSNSLLAQIDVGESIEAEDTTIDGTVVTFDDDRDNASGLAFIQLQATGTSTFNVTNVASAGTYKLRVDTFNNNQSLDIALIINGNSQTLSLQPSNWEYQGEAQFTYVDITLNSGVNTIQFARLNDDIMLDKFAVYENFNAYYISTTGLDSNDGLSPTTPWQSIDKVAAALATNNNSGYANPGDKFLFKSGDTFLGQLLANRSVA